LAEVIQTLKARAIEGLIDLEQGLKLCVLSDFSPFLFFHQRNNFILFAGDPGFKILNVLRVMKRLELMPGSLTALKHVKIGTKVVGLNE
jgi:hypothetical protein